MAKQKPPRCSNKWANTAQHWLLQQGAGDLTLPLVLNERDGTINSNAMNAIVEDFNVTFRAEPYGVAREVSSRSSVQVALARACAAAAATAKIKKTMIFV